MDNDELYSRLGAHGRIDRYQSACNRRAEPRIMIFLKATLHYEEHQFAVVTRDVSRNSIGLISYEPLELGLTVRIDLRLPWDEIVNRQLEIVRCDERSGFYDVAGMFA